MCTGLEVAALAASAAGTGASLVNQDQALKRQDQEAARGIMNQANLRQQASSRVGQQIQQTATANPEAERQAALGDFTAALRRAQLGKGGAGLNDVSGASGRFAEEVGAARTAAGTENATTAGTLARIDAPRFQRLREGEGVAATASDLSTLNKNSSMEDFLTQLRVSSQTANPWIQGASQGLTALGGSLASRVPRTTRVPAGTLNTTGLMDTPTLPAGVRYD